jgi:hypothetical protein
MAVFRNGSHGLEGRPPVSGKGWKDHVRSPAKPVLFLTAGKIAAEARKGIANYRSYTPEWRIKFFKNPYTGKK